MSAGGLKKWTAFKVVLAVLYLLVTIFCVWLFIDACAETGKGRELGIAITIAILIGVYSLIGYVPLTIAALVGVIKAAKAYKRQQCTLGTLVYFIVFLILPLATYGAMVLIFPLIV